MRHIISVLLANEAGALHRVAGLFSARGYNIESLTVAPTQNETVSRLTLVTTGSDDVIDQINKQLKKLVDVVDMADLTEGEHIERELLLLKLQTEVGEVAALSARAEEFGARLLDDTPSSVTLELSGTGTQIDEFVQEMSARARITELVRTGAGAIACGDQSLKLHG